MLSCQWRRAAPGDGQLVPRGRPRIGGLFDRTLRGQGRPLPGRGLPLPRSRRHGAHQAVLRLARPHPRQPHDPEVVNAQAAEWMEGRCPRPDSGLPGSGPLSARADCAIRPRRPRDARRDRAAAEWVRWLGERGRPLRARLSGVRRRRSADATSVSTTTRLTRGRRAGRRTGREEGLVLLVGLERVDGCGQLVHRLDRADSLSMGEFIGGTKSSAVQSSGCSGVLVTGHLPFGSSSHLGCTP